MTKTQQGDMEGIVNLFRSMASELVSDEARLEVRATQMGDCVVNLIVRASSADTSRLIGRRGATCGALRTLIQAAGASLGVMVNLTGIQEPSDDGKTCRHARFVAASDWPKERFAALMLSLSRYCFPRSKELLVEEQNDETYSATHYAVSVDKVEPNASVIRIEEALNVYFASAGKANGRQQISVSVRAVQHTEPAQPKSAAGRHAREAK
jgi:predicted RNA-binding protein YlqC (UPF0109 family)